MKGIRSSSTSPPPSPPPQTIHFLFAFSSVLFLLALAPEPAQCVGGNILVIFQHFGYSHFSVYYPVLRELANRGHNLTVITYIKNPEPHPNYTELLLTGEAQMHVTTFDDFVVGRTPAILLAEYFGLHGEGQRSCRKFYESPHVETVLASHAATPFDLVITEYFNTDCHLGVPYLMDVPVAAFSSCALMPWLYDRILLPDTPSHVQSEFIGFPEQLSLAERLLNFAQTKALQFLYRHHTNRHDNRLIKQYLNVEVNVHEVAKRLTGVIFVNQHYTLSGSRPLTPQLVEVGGLHITPKRLNGTLPVELSDFLAGIRPNEDVLVLSFGSMLRASSLDEAKLRAILKVIAQRDLKVIWKWESDALPSRSEKVLFVKWLPQLAVLCNPKVKYFWGHGGMLSTTEAVHCGKPLILTPIYGDQFVNAHAVQNRKIGVILDYHAIDERSVEATLNEIQRPRYSANAVALSQVFRERDMPPLQKAIWHIEHLVKHKKLAVELMQTKAVHLNFFVYYSLDAVSLILIGILIAIVLCRNIWRLASSSRRQRSVVGSDKEKKKKH